MNSFTLKLQGATRAKTIEGVTSFVGEDASGSFGLLAGHDRFMTTLVIGLARFRAGKQPWSYLAVPGAVLYFNHNVLTLSTRQFLIDEDYTRISADLQKQLLTEEERLRDTRESLHNMEEQVLRHLWELGRQDLVI